MLCNGQTLNIFLLSKIGILNLQGCKVAQIETVGGNFNCENVGGSHNSNRRCPSGRDPGPWHC